MIAVLTNRAEKEILAAEDLGGGVGAKVCGEGLGEDVGGRLGGGVGVLPEGFTK